MKKLLTIFGCCLALLLFGCSSSNVEPPAPLVKFTPTVQVQQVWSRSVGDTDAILHLGVLVASDGKNVYTASNNGDVYAFDLKNGSKVWTKSLDQRISGGPAVADGLVAVAASNGTVVALDATTGKERWQVSVNNEILTAPAVGENTVVLHTTDDHVIALSADSGKMLWNISRQPPDLALRGSSAPVIVGDTVYAGLNSGRLLALKLADGAQRWDVTVARPTGGDALSRLNDLDGVLAEDAGDLYAVTYHGKVARISSQGGQIQWARSMSSYTGVSVNGDNVYVSDMHGDIWDLKKSSGVPRWSQPALRARDVTLPVPYGNTVVVGDLKGYLHFLSDKDGSFVARMQLDSDPIQAPPIVAGGLLVALSTGGELAAYRIVPPATKH